MASTRTLLYFDKETLYVQTWVWVILQDDSVGAVKINKYRKFLHLLKYMSLKADACILASVTFEIWIDGDIFQWDLYFPLFRSYKHILSQYKHIHLSVRLDILSNHNQNYENLKKFHDEDKHVSA